MKTAIVTTTIHVPTLLRDYAENAKKFGHEDVVMYVVGDKKTPSGAADFCENIEKEFGYPVNYFDVTAQEKLLKPYGALARHLPWNSISRRNVGLLQAYQDGADVIITIDDDNFALPEEDFIGRHSGVGQEQTVDEVSSSTGWYNVCELLEEKHGLPFYHRGFPLTERWKQPEIALKKVQRRVAVNAGLWLEAPDIDALTWLDLPIEAIAYKEAYPNGVALAAGTWCPFNSQNTALAREVLPAYFLSPHVGRYDDVWASYIIERIADRLGHAVQFGRPLVRQARNPHDYFKDFDLERLGMELTPRLTQWLRAVELTGKGYSECLAEIVDRLTEDWPQLGGFTEGMKIWQEIHEKVRVA